ncbi:carbon-nitrogen family hydrolase [Methanococcoides burtonii]|uniref:Carbon-nitrogen hydrolase family protein n=1 Tax=Methanococcoides burtonii (strain DSM 6242 / NBRC 107633 / OCM 468 / ACE-M) TaxID=259564 RepID=Q12ZA5_METBU|nr:Carbon-nitrogen hydrolase family protein [Methanococcoides burtonii DSM 6242]
MKRGYKVETIKIAAIQMDICHCNKQKNIKKALHFSEEAISKGADIIVLPEVFSTGFCYEELENIAESGSYPTIKELEVFSKKNKCIIVGSIIEKHSSKNRETYTNLGFCLEDGELVGTYTKTHPFGKEKEYFTSGDVIEPIHLKERDLTVGLQICYEMRFPEIARKLCLSGADILMTIAEFPNPREHQWRTLATARAIENQVFHIACNRSGSDPTSTFFGGSMIIDPLGNVIADAKDGECVIIEEIDTSIMKKTRKEIPVFDDRRPDIYK